MKDNCCHVYEKNEVCGVCVFRATRRDSWLPSTVRFVLFDTWVFFADWCTVKTDSRNPLEQLFLQKIYAKSFPLSCIYQKYSLTWSIHWEKARSPFKTKSKSAESETSHNIAIIIPEFRNVKNMYNAHITVSRNSTCGLTWMERFLCKSVCSRDNMAYFGTLFIWQCAIAWTLIVNERCLMFWSKQFNKYWSQDFKSARYIRFEWTAPCTSWKSQSHRLTMQSHTVSLTMLADLCSKWSALCSLLKTPDVSLLISYQNANIDRIPSISVRQLATRQTAVSRVN